MVASINTVDEIKRVIAQFANAFDLKDWQALGVVLADRIECDYQDLRKEIKIYTKENYVALREASLQTLNTQHLLTNFDIHQASTTAQCRVSALILRQDQQGSCFNTHAIYDFTLQMQEEGWHIHKIKQRVLWNEGDASIHSGVKSE